MSFLRGLVPQLSAGSPILAGRSATASARDLEALAERLRGLDAELAECEAEHERALADVEPILGKLAAQLALDEMTIAEYEAGKAEALARVEAADAARDRVGRAIEGLRARGEEIVEAIAAERQDEIDEEIAAAEARLAALRAQVAQAEAVRAAAVQRGATVTQWRRVQRGRFSVTALAALREEEADEGRRFPGASSKEDPPAPSPSLSRTSMRA